MLKKIINELKRKKDQLENSITDSPIEEKKQEFKIELSQEQNFLKMEISDYISIVDYVERMKLIDHFRLEDFISNAVLWNNGKQKVNKGFYYVVIIYNRLYNILLNTNIIKIDERIKNNDIIEERILSFNVEDCDYSYTVHNHDQTGNTFYTRYYKTRISFGKLDLSTEEFIDEISSVIKNLENIEGMKNVLDIELLKACILENLKRESPQKKL